MADIKTQLHALDLRQIEAIKHLVAQLTNEITTIDQYSNATAVAIQNRARLKGEVPGSENMTSEDVERNIKGLEKAFEKHVTVAKAAIFNASNTLKQLHDNRVSLMRESPIPEETIFDIEDDDEE